MASIEYLGVVASKLRKDTFHSQFKLSTIDQIINDIKLEQQRDLDYDHVKDKRIRIEVKKKLIISKISPYSTGAKPDVLKLFIDNNSAELISQYFAMWFEALFLDQSTSVRETAVDLVKKFVLSRSELIENYYDILHTISKFQKFV